MTGPFKLMVAPVTPSTLRALRRELGWSQLDAALWIGTSERTWRRWETGRTPIAPLVARAIDSLPPHVLIALIPTGDTP